MVYIFDETKKPFELIREMVLEEMRRVLKIHARNLRIERQMKEAKIEISMLNELYESLSSPKLNGTRGRIHSHNIINRQLNGEQLRLGEGND